MGTRRRTQRRRANDRRAVSPLVGVLALLGITVCLAGIVAVGATGWTVASPAPTAAFDLSVDGANSTIEIEHRGGDVIDVRDLTVTVVVDGAELSSQPSVPFVGAEGFAGAPSGPFNDESEPAWRAGDSAVLTVADGNDPGLDTGDSVTVRLAVDGHRVAELEDVAA